MCLLVDKTAARWLFFSQKISSFCKRTEIHVCGIVWLGEVRTCETLTRKSAEDNCCVLLSHVEDQQGKRADPGECTTNRVCWWHWHPVMRLECQVWDVEKFAAGGAEITPRHFHLQHWLWKFQESCVGVNLAMNRRRATVRQGSTHQQAGEHPNPFTCWTVVRPIGLSAWQC